MTEVAHSSVPKFAHEDWALWVRASGATHLVRILDTREQSPGVWVYSIGLEPNEKSGLTEGGHLTCIGEEDLTMPTSAGDLLLAMKCDLILTIARLEQDLSKAKNDLAAVNRVRKLVL